MKRRRENDEETGDSEIRRCGIDGLSLAAAALLVKPNKAPPPEAAAHHIPTRPFLHLCNLLIQLLGISYFFAK